MFFVTRSDRTLEDDFMNMLFGINFMVLGFEINFGLGPIVFPGENVRTAR